MDDATNCPMCGCANHASGVLGNRIHYHCQDCGWWYDAINDAEPEHAPEDGPRTLTDLNHWSHA